MGQDTLVLGCEVFAYYGDPGPSMYLVLIETDSRMQCEVRVLCQHNLLLQHRICQHSSFIDSNSFVINALVF